jgi:hypothetical protein
MNNIHDCYQARKKDRGASLWHAAHNMNGRTPKITARGDRRSGIGFLPRSSSIKPLQPRVKLARDHELLRAISICSSCSLSPPSEKFITSSWL